MNVIALPRRQAIDRKTLLQDSAAESMRMLFDHIDSKGTTQARTPEEFFGFCAEDVAEMHFTKRDAGRGFWYRLNDGRVIDAAGRPSETDRTWYGPSAD